VEFTVQAEKFIRELWRGERRESFGQIIPRTTSNLMLQKCCLLFEE